MKSILVAIILSSLASFCMAEAVSVGRAEIKLSGDNWQSFPIAEEVSPFGGDWSGQIKSERKVLVKKSSSNAVEAIVLVSGSYGNLGVAGKLQYSPKCPSDKYWYRNGNEGFNRPFAECWGVLKGQPIAQGDLGKAIPEVFPLLSQENLQMPKGAHILFSSYRNDNGTYLTVQMFIAPGFSMPNESVVESVPEGVDAKLMQYGVQLSNAVRASVMSWSGKLVVPGFSFADQ
jgi:hypothetical protein